MRDTELDSTNTDKNCLGILWPGWVQGKERRIEPPLSRDETQGTYLMRRMLLVPEGEGGNRQSWTPS